MLDISIIRTIIQERKSGKSLRLIASELSISKSVVGMVLAKIEKGRLNIKKAALLSDEALCELIYPTKKATLEAGIDWEEVDQQLSHAHINLILVYEALIAGKTKISYSHFVRLYRKWSRQHKPVTISHNDHCIPGEKLEIDFSGDALNWVNGEGEVRKGRMFTACLPYSGLIFAVVCNDETTSSWCQGVIQALNYFGGVPRTLIVDNSKALVVKASKYEGIITPLIKDLVEHYGMECWSCQPYRPKQKNRVEASVKMVQTWVQGRLEMGSAGLIYARDIKELNEKVRQQVDELNRRPFVNKSTGLSRQQKFMSEEFASLSPLPEYPYEICRWLILTVDKSHCVRISQDGGHRYSVPVEFTGQAVFVRLSQEEVQIFGRTDNQLIARHERHYELHGNKTHIAETHMTNEEKNRRRSPDYFIEIFIRRGINPQIAKAFVQGSWQKSGEFASRQRMHAINRHLLRNFPPSLLNEAFADAVDLNQHRYNFLHDLLVQKQELQRRQMNLRLDVDDQYRTPTHSNIRNHYE